MATRRSAGIPAPADGGFVAWRLSVRPASSTHPLSSRWPTCARCPSRPRSRSTIASRAGPPSASGRRRGRRRARPLPTARDARYLVLRGFDERDGRGYYETIDLELARHPADHPGLRDERRTLADPARRALPVARRDAARVQDGRVPALDRAGRDYRLGDGRAGFARTRSSTARRLAFDLGI